MSIASWRRAYYPVEARDTAPSDALEHSIRKWQGLDRFWLLFHSLRRDGDLVHGWYHQFDVTAETCALCHHYQDDTPTRDVSCGIETYCTRCPLAIARGGVPCDRQMLHETISPYDAFVERGDHDPMLSWLLRVARETALNAAAGHADDAVTP